MTIRYLAPVTHRKTVLAQQLSARSVCELQQSERSARLHHVACHCLLAQPLQRGHIAALPPISCAAWPAQAIAS